MKSSHAIVLFDGVCNLCAGTVRFVVRHDPAGYFRFAALQSETGRSLLEQHGLDSESFDTFVVIEDGRAHIRSHAFLALIPHLSGPWRLLRVLALVPRPLLDRGYAIIVQNRYRWFGKQDACLVPSPELSQRFLA
jgi:predicted DCC family thiol-disulfide oxidoreductase YuxK